MQVNLGSRNFLPSFFISFIFHPSLHRNWDKFLSYPVAKPNPPSHITRSAAICAYDIGTISQQALGCIGCSSDSRAHTSGHGSYQLGIRLDLQDFKGGQCRQLGGDGSLEIIVIEPEASEICQLSKFRGNGSSQGAIGHTDRREFRHEANFSWNSTSNDIVVDPHGD
jgi:hypothetical protein